MLHIENDKIFVELEINKKELDLDPLTKDQIKDLMRIHRQSLIIALKNRMEKCEKQLVLAATNKTPMKQTEYGIFWNHGKFSFIAYKAMKEGIDQLQAGKYIEFLRNRMNVIQLIQALMNDEEGISNHEFIGILMEFAITPRNDFLHSYNGNELRMRELATSLLHSLFSNSLKISVFSQNGSRATYLTRLSRV